MNKCKLKKINTTEPHIIPIVTTKNCCDTCFICQWLEFICNTATGFQI